MIQISNRISVLKVSFFFLKGYHTRKLFKLKKGSIPFVFDQRNVSQPLSTAESACESPTYNTINSQLISSEDICSKKETPDDVISKYLLTNIIWSNYAEGKL